MYEFQVNYCVEYGIINYTEKSQNYCYHKYIEYCTNLATFLQIQVKSSNLSRTSLKTNPAVISP